MKLLAVGDLHLGRRPSRLPVGLAGGEDARALGASGAWGLLIDAAIEGEVDVVVLAGDVVERENDFFEAYRELYAGVERLAAAGIQVYGVAGNHDVRVLPRLADQISKFRLMGQVGVWEKVGIEIGGEAVTLWGWSFPEERVVESPLAGVRFERGAGVNIGLLHCDRDQAGSPYAPVAGRELEAAGLDAWLLGHIHKPDVLSVANPNGYLGSVAGSHPGEPGARGPWLIEVAGGRISKVDQWVLAPLRWESLAVDIGGVGEVEEVRGRILSALRGLDEELGGGRWPVKAVGLRVDFIGRSRFGDEALGLISGEDRGRIHVGGRGTHYFIERLANRTLPEISLEALVEQGNPPGLLAARLLVLGRPAGDEERQRLIAGARQVFARRMAGAPWGVLAAEEPDDEEAADLLRRAGMSALERILAQKEEGL